MLREIKFSEAILEATDQCMAADANVYVMGLGVTDPKGTFGTTLGLAAKYGPKRVLDMPTSENGMTGVAIGSAIRGKRPILTHQRLDFNLLALDQIINNAAKWHYMFNGLMKVPLVIRMVIGRGWGQGPQHSQSLQALFAHIPGLKVVMPTTPHDAKGMLIAAVEDDNPVMFLEHRWLHGIFGPVPTAMYRVPLGTARVAREGRDVTFVTLSYMTLEALKAAEVLAKDGISAEVVDVRCLKPLDETTILTAVKKTGRVLVADAAWRMGAFSSEILAVIAERAHGCLKTAPRRLTLPDVPVPSTPALANLCYPRAIDLINATREMFGKKPLSETEAGFDPHHPLDVPDPQFTGPF